MRVLPQNVNKFLNSGETCTILPRMFKRIAITAFFALLAYPASLAADGFRHDWFWFVYERHIEDTFRYTVFRPFYLHNIPDHPGGDETYRAVLPPVIFSEYRRGPDYARYSLFGLIGGNNYRHENSVDDYDLILPPLLYGSSTDPNDRYFFLWPVGGTIRGKLGQDRIAPWVFPGVALFFLFPLSPLWPAPTLQATITLAAYVAASLVPVYTEFSYRDFHAQAVFWPFIMWGEGGGRKSLRIFPFYARHTKEGFYDRKMVMLLYNYSESYTKNRTYYTRFLFPFYGEKWTDDGMVQSHTVLWPFFSWGYNKLNGEESLNCPWPLFQKAKSDRPKMEKLIVFPFYGHYRYESHETVFYTPLYFRMTRDTPHYKSRSSYTALIIWNFKREYRNPDPYYGSRWSYFKIWPLFHWEKSDNGNRDFSLLSVLPFRDPDGYERIYGPIFSLAEYHRRGDETGFGLLMRTFYLYRKGDYFSWKVPLLASYESYNGAVSDWSVLLGAFGYFRDTRGSGVRLFWYPFVTDKDNVLNAALPENLVDPFENSALCAGRFSDEASASISFGRQLCL